MLSRDISLTYILWLVVILNIILVFEPGLPSEPFFFTTWIISDIVDNTNNSTRDIGIVFL